MNKSKGIVIIIICVLMAVTILTSGLFSMKNSSEIIMFGDSIYGNFRDDDTAIPVLLGRKFNLNCYNCGLGGTTMAFRSGDSPVLAHENASSMVAIADAYATNDFSYVLSAQPAKDDGDLFYFDKAVEHISKLDLKRARLIVIEHGINDFLYEIPSGLNSESNDIYDYKGAVSHVVDRLKTKYPDVKILLVSPVYGQADISDYAMAMKEVAEQYGVYFCDMNGENIVNADNLYEVTDDGTHLNTNGRTKYADILGEYILDNHLID